MSLLDARVLLKQVNSGDDDVHVIHLCRLELPFQACDQRLHSYADPSKRRSEGGSPSRKNLLPSRLFMRLQNILSLHNSNHQAWYASKAVEAAVVPSCPYCPNDAESLLQVTLLQAGQQHSLRPLAQATVRLSHSGCRPQQLGPHGPRPVPRVQHGAGSQQMQPMGTATRRFSSKIQVSPQGGKVPVKTVEGGGGTSHSAATAAPSLRYSVRGAGSTAYRMLPGSVSTPEQC